MILRYPLQTTEVNIIEQTILTMEEEINFPVTFSNIETAKKEEIKKGFDYSKFKKITIEDHDIWVNEFNKIILPETLIQETVKWYHLCLAHPGINRTYNSIAMHFFAKKLMKNVMEFIKSCEGCIKGKRSHPKYGKLPPALDTIYNPWEVIQVDLFGPWSFNDVTNKEK